MVRLISRQRGGLAALKLTKLFGIDEFPAAKDSGKVLIIIIYCYLIIVIVIVVIVIVIVIIIIIIIIIIYKYGSDIGLERLSYQSKIISINIRISLLFSREKAKHVRFLKSS